MSQTSTGSQTRTLKKPSTLLALASLLFASAALADVDFAASDVPTVFFISKSDDRNRVDYGIRLDATCRPARSPMVVYWREFEGTSAGRVTHGLNLFEGPVYGVGTQRVLEERPDGATLQIDIRALASRRIEVRTGPGTTTPCTASAILEIGGVPAILENVHLTLGDSPGSLRFADIHGHALEGGRAVTEHIVR